MKTSELKQIIREEIAKLKQEAILPANQPPQKTQGSANFAKIAFELNVDLEDFNLAISDIKAGEDPLSLSLPKKNAFVLLVANLIKTNQDTLVQAFANELKKLEVKPTVPA